MISAVAASFLAATDLDELADLRESLPDNDIEPLAAAVRAWDDEQGVANVLMYPSVLSPDVAVVSVLRGLADDHPYLRLAAAVGAGDIDPADVSPEQRFGLVEALLNLMASDDGPAAARASVSVAALLHAEDGPDLVTMLAHPEPLVRRNLEVVLLGLVGPAGLTALLADRSRVSEADAAEAVAAYAADGIDPRRTVGDQRVLTGLAYIPSLSEWRSD